MIARVRRYVGRRWPDRKGLCGEEDFAIRHRPVRGKKNLSATILESWFGMGFFVRFWTSIREENVRTFRALGPVRVSAAFSARGWTMDCWRLEEMARSFDGVSAYIWWRRSGSCFDGKGFLLSFFASSLNPASSRAERPTAVRIEVLCCKE